MHEYILIFPFVLRRRSEAYSWHYTFFWGFWSWKDGDISLYDTTAGNDYTNGEEEEEEQIYNSGARKRMWKTEEVCSEFLRIPQLFCLMVLMI